ncbi:hypothetical protein WCN79_14535 [Xanthomonas axonopodis pv. vasculorum]|nr:hypothetical protein [Xanthomonas axonopodis]
MIEGTLDGRLIALDARSGLQCPDFGSNDRVDITVGMGEAPPCYVSINIQLMAGRAIGQWLRNVEVWKKRTASGALFLSATSARQSRCAQRLPP